MKFFEIMDLIAFYGVDVCVLAVLTTCLSQILKTTVLKNAPNRLYTLLPFIIGVTVYLIYTMISRVSFSYAFLNFGFVFEQGIKTGGIATVVYIIYEQFIRGKASFTLSENALAALLIDFVAEGFADEVAAEILKSPERAKEIISAYKRENIDEEKTAALLQLSEKLLSRTT